MTGQSNDRIVVAVVEEQEILRRGLVASLEEDHRLQVVASADDLIGDGVDIAVVSTSAALRGAFTCPIVVCGDRLGDLDPATSANAIAGVLHPGTVTGAQLRATVHAAAAGLHVQANGTADAKGNNGHQPALDARARRVLELLAAGDSTREIAQSMNYSERTIKKLITTLEHRFDARNRAQVVAHAIRLGLI